MTEPEELADDWALTPESSVGDDPFESPWLAEPDAFLVLGDDVDPEWVEAVEEIDYAEEDEPFALPDTVAGFDPALLEPSLDESFDPSEESADWEYWSPSDSSPDSSGDWWSM